MAMKRSRQQVQPAPPSSGPSSSAASSSLPRPPGKTGAVPLPTSHIRRTPSELQLADEVQRAEFDDVRMYARLVVGMQSQIVARATAQTQGLAATSGRGGGGGDGGYVHPLSEKSLRGVVGTRLAKDEDLFKEEADEDAAAANDGDWVNLVEGRRRSEATSDDLSFPWSTRPLSSKSGSDGSLSTHASDAAFLHGGDEDDFVFSLEL